MLKIKKLSVAIDSDYVLNNINLSINAGEIHALIGPEQSGKSALLNVINGSDILFVSKGSITLDRKNITELLPPARSILGIFTCFHEVPNIEGLTHSNLIKAALKVRNTKLTPNEIEKKYKEQCAKLGLSTSTGSKFISDEDEFIKAELAQIPLLDSKLLLLDEIDKNLEPSEFQTVALYIKEIVSTTKSALVVSNNKEFLDFLQPTHVHVMVNGEINAHGDAELYKRILDHDYSQFPQS